MTGTTQAQIFAAEYAKDAAEEMLETIRANGRKAGRVTRIALAVSMPHQVAFILGLAPLAWGDVRAVLESCTLIAGALGIPVAVDYLILICIQILAARGAATVSKKVAFYGMLFPVLVSGTVNVLAPAPTLIRVLFGVAVVLIPLAEGIRVMTRPDFGKIERMEIEVGAQVGDAERQGKRCEPGCACGRHTPRRGKSRSRRGRRQPKTPTAAQVSPGMPPVDAPSSQQIADIVG